MTIKENHLVLVSVDFTPKSLSAIKYSYIIAKHTKCKIVLLYISAISDTDRSVDLENLAETAKKESSLLVETMIIKGELYDVLKKKSDELIPSTIILGLDDTFRFKTRFGGMTIHKFINSLKCPIITLRESHVNDSFKNITMPFDLAPESREKVPIAVQFSRYFSADIRIVSIFPPDDEKYENEILPYLQQVKKYIKVENCNCSNKTIPSSTPAESILEYAASHEAFIIIQMNQKDLTFSEKINGTVGQKIVQISKIPVFTINPMKRESTSMGGNAS